MQLSDFDYSLPEELIAQIPASPRDSSRLLAVSASGKLTDSTVRQLPDYLREGDVLVFNDTKVIPARLFARKGEAPIDITLLKRQQGAVWECFARPARKLKEGDTLDFSGKLTAMVASKNLSGTVDLQFSQSGDAFYHTLAEIGQMPLPPYIHREQKEEEDFLNYQTLFAARQGAVAAPTAGLHFSEELLQAITAKGVQTQRVTLHVGGGTFLPVRVENIAEHKMHSEWMEINEATAAALNQAKAEGRRIISVGTTSLRCLESAADDQGVLHAQNRETDIFITPGYRFKVVDALLTNFHLPKSTLFMLVSAFSGREVMQHAYAHAVAEKYRFFSYGDACFLER